MSGNHMAVNPFAGNPPTCEYEENGAPVIQVDAAALEPFRMKAAGVLFFLTLLVAGSAYGILQDGNGLPAGYGLWFWSGLIAAFAGLSLLPMTRLTVKFTPTQVLVRRGWSGEAWQAFAVVHDPAFVMTDHRLAQAEERSRQHAARQNPAANPEVIYGNSFHLALDYRKQRYQLMTVYGDQDAQRIFMRLRACLDIAKARAGKGGAPVEPAHDWPDRPGRVPSVRRRS